MTTVGEDRIAAAVESDVIARPSPVWRVLGVGGVLAAGIVLRFLAPSDLWLDEALSVSIARLPVSDIPEALRTDGAPPLYYVLLHGWMVAFGGGDAAVRAFSGVASAATLPVLWFIGRRLGGRGPAAVLVIAATNPFALHYATETRMYSLVALEVALGTLALLRALDRPTWPRLLALAAAAAALLLTHYWGIYLVTAVGIGMTAVALRGTARWRHPARRALLALVAGALAFMPWLPLLLFQARHTAAPWGRPPRPGNVVTLVTEFSGGSSEAARLLGLVLFVLVLLGLFARRVAQGVLELRLPPRAVAGALAGAVLGTTGIAVTAGLVTGTPFVGRYVSVVLVPFLLLAAMGVVALADSRPQALALATVASLGLAVGAQRATVNRTQAGEVAQSITALARPGDVVAFCPDQLGPSVHRVLPEGLGLHLTTYPKGLAPTHVDWVDYGRAIRASDPAAFGRRLLERAGPDHDVFLYWRDGFRPFGTRCSTLREHLAAGRSREVVVGEPKTRSRYEHGTLSRYPAP